MFASLMIEIFSDIFETFWNYYPFSLTFNYTYLLSVFSFIPGISASVRKETLRRFTSLYLVLGNYPTTIDDITFDCSSPLCLSLFLSSFRLLSPICFECRAFSILFDNDVNRTFPFYPDLAFPRFLLSLNFYSVNYKEYKDDDDVLNIVRLHRQFS